MTTISSEFFDPKEEDILLKLSMPKRELRISTVEKMKQAKLQEQQEEVQKPIQSPSLLPPQPIAPPPPPPQPQQTTLTQSPAQPSPPMTSIQETAQQPVQQEIRVQETKPEPQPLPEPAQVYHQSPQPPRDMPTPSTPFSNIDMTRIENLTRNIMYRDPQLQKPLRNNSIWR